MKEILENMVKGGPFTPEQAGMIYYCVNEILFKNKLLKREGNESDLKV